MKEKGSEMHLILIFIVVYIYIFKDISSKKKNIIVGFRISLEHLFAS